MPSVTLKGRTTYWTELSATLPQSNLGTNFAKIINNMSTKSMPTSQHLEMLPTRGLQEALDDLKEENKTNCIKQSERLFLWGPTNLVISSKQ